MGVAVAALFVCAHLIAQQEATTESRLAAAKLAESRGELALAEQDLRAALVGSTGAARAQVETELRGLLARQGRAETAAVQDPANGGDPIQRLLAVLERGSNDRPEVRAAVDELHSLRALALPALLTALPKMGPFGLSNAMSILSEQDDARIAPSLLARMEGADPAVLTAILARVDDMHSSVAMMVAREVAKRDVPPNTLITALQVLLHHRTEQEAPRELALRLAKVPSTQAVVLELVRKEKAGWVMETLTELMAATDPSVRAGATSRWLVLQKDLTEAAALAQIGKLPSAQQWWVARDAAAFHPTWVQCGLMALQGADRDGVRKESWFQAMEWWRQPEQAAPALLALPDTTTALDHVAMMVARGWVAPVSLQEPLERAVVASASQGPWQTLIRAMPTADEGRALATWDRMGPEVRSVFVRYAVEGGKPWFRLVAKYLASSERADGIAEQCIPLDWNGAPPEAIDALVAVVERFPTDAKGQFMPWHEAVMTAYRMSPNLPAAVVLPLAARDYSPAFAQVATKHPHDALAFARSKIMNLNLHESLDGLLRQHGTAADVPLAARLIPMDGGWRTWPGIESLFLRYGSGRLEVVALGRSLPNESGFLRSYRQSHALRATKGLRAEQLADVLAMLGDLDQTVAEHAERWLGPQLQPEHGPLLTQAVESLLAKPIDDSMTEQLLTLLRLMSATKDLKCAPVAQRVLQQSDLHDAVADQATKTALALAGPERRRLLAELLTSPHPGIIAVALTDAEMATNADLRALGKAAILRLGERLSVGDNVFEALAPIDAVSLASDLLTSARFSMLPRSLCLAAVTRLRRSPVVGSLASTIALGIAHPSQDVRWRVAVELGNTFTRAAAPFLLEMLKDESPDVRKVAQTSLDQIANYLDARAKWEERLK